MGVNDAAEMLEVAKEEVCRLERDLAAALAYTPAAGDEHHSIDELYEYRMLYNAHAAHGWDAAGIPVVKSWHHSDGEKCFGGGWFIVTATLPTGQVSNHYAADHWDLFNVHAVDLPPEYDGHTPEVAAERLRSAISVPSVAGTPAADEPCPGCTGAGSCQAPAHQHGCFADLVGHCNEPEAHAEVAGEPEREAQVTIANALAIITDWSRTPIESPRGDRSRMAAALEDVARILAAGRRRESQPQDERIEAWDAIAKHPFFRDCYATDGTLLAAMLAKLSAEPRTVTTVEELDALNLDAVVVDVGGCPRTKRFGNSHMPGGWTHAGNSPLRSSELADGRPMTVVYEGRDFRRHVTPSTEGGES
ncbi:hypothetical protein [Cryobacterium cryoconiti]|uniref:WDGH domain-containing protein n=1 Tax=Cryobacterium cryoconiti TaxID=1259239 RepID=A0A4Y8JSH7_9MICO|nr:hypothetical protein [Cryobacterium cryoconiti]TFD27466.1 hypothetical protein E3T49_13055 [Cryobacterium cryoconiti]